MLFTIGLRIERLLYFGFFLLLICALQVYLTTVAVHFSAKETRTIESLIDVIERNASILQDLYEKDSAPSSPNSEREARVERMRKILGLEAARRLNTDNGPTYASKLQELLLSLPDWSSLRGQLEGVFSSDKDPLALIAGLKELQKSRTPEKGTVLGIESPRQLTLQYGSSDFRFSALPLAAGLLVALYPLVFVWLGSFYITRQRELMAIRRANDYKDAFPHILNFVVVDSSNFQKSVGLPVKRKEVRFNLFLSRMATTLTRFVFVVMTVVPLVVGIGYSSFQISQLLEFPTFVEVLTSIAFLTLASLAFVSAVQEVITLHGKTFYE